MKKSSAGILPVEGIACNQHKHHMHTKMDHGKHHKNKHHSLVHSHNKHSIDLDLLAGPSYQAHPTS